MTKGLPPADQKIQELLAARRKGFEAAKPNAEAGAKVFEKNCMICHTLASKGAKVGPHSTGSASAAWTGCWRTCWTRTGTSIKTSA